MLNEHLEHEVTQNLLNAAQLSSRNIDVEADNGVVKLEGDVPSFRCKLAAHQIASSCDSVKQVVNELQVVGSEPEDDLQLTAKITTSIEADPRLVHHPVRIDVTRGIATLTGYASNEFEKNYIADLVAGIDGVREINDMLIVNPDRVMANREHCVTVVAAMKRIIGMEDEQIRVAVVDEMARLSGKVDAIWKKQAAEGAVRQFGILKVCNEIVVDPAPPSGGPQA